jgi:hypothetical protein
MPITVDTDLDRDLTIFKVTGTLEFEEVMLDLKAFYDGEPTQKVLVDLTDQPTIQISSQEIQEITAYQPRFEGKRVPGRTAILATTDLHFGLARKFEAQSDIEGAPHSVRVFKRIPDWASIWCNPRIYQGIPDHDSNGKIC